MSQFVAMEAKLKELFMSEGSPLRMKMGRMRGPFQCEVG